MNKFKNIIVSYIRKLNSGMRVRKNLVNIPENIPEKKDKHVINIILFLLTVISTSFIGGRSGNTFIEHIISGLPYSITLLTILLFHEFGHYFAAKRFGVKATLPYFIPMPIPPIGTMGAIIKTRSKIPDRKALFYIGTMGPLPGFIISLAAVIIGIYLSEINPLPKADGTILIFGDSLLFTALVKIIHGSIPQGYDIFLSQYAFAGWVGFLITGLNLMPIGQLDGSHILYALIGKKQLIAGWLSVFLLFILSFIFYGWFLWIIITFLLLMVGHPHVEKGPNLTLREKILGWSCMVIFILIFVPVPIKIM